MYFVGWKGMDLEIFLLSENKKVDIEMELYDQRFRRTARERTQLLTSTGLKLPNEISGKVNVSPVIAKNDELQRISKLYNLYFLIEPQYIPMDNKTVCDQRKESFDEWMTSKVFLSTFARKPTIDCQIEFLALNGYCRLNPLRTLAANLNLPSDTFDIYLNDFLIITCLVDEKLTPRVPLPLLMESSESAFLTEEWILIMSWWKKISKQLRPLTNKLQEIYRSSAPINDRKSALRLKKSEKILLKLKKVLKECKSQQLELFLSPDMHKFDEDFKQIEVANDYVGIDIEDVYEEVLFKTSRLIKDKEFVEELLLFSVKTAYQTVLYLKSIQKTQTDHQNFDERHNDSLVQELRILNGKLKSSRSRKVRAVSETIEDSVASLLIEIGRVLQEVTGRVAEGGVIKMNERARYERGLQNGYELVNMLMDAGSTIALDFVYDHYNFKTQKEFMAALLKQYRQQMTQTCMRNIAIKRGPQTAHYQNAIDRKDRLQVVSTRFYDSLLSLVERVVEDSIPVMKPPDKVYENDLPSRIIYVDFPKVLKQLPKVFSVCPHPLQDIEEQTEHQMLRIQRKFLNEFEININGIMQLIKKAEECVSLSDMVSMPSLLSKEDKTLEKEMKHGEEV